MNRTAINQKANREIKKQLTEDDMYCWVCGANNTVWLTIAHRHKRNWYKGKPDELLWNPLQWIIADINCHSTMEKDKELTEKIFLKIRGEEKENESN